MDSLQSSKNICTMEFTVISQPKRAEVASISQLEIAEVAGISQTETAEINGISQPEMAEVASISQPEIAEVASISQPEREEGRRKHVSRKPKIVGKVSKSCKGQKKNPSQPSTSEMVVESIKSLKKRSGTTEEAIRKFIEDNYDVNIKARRRHIKQFLINGVEKGLLEKVGEDGVTERFKVKKESAKKATEKKRNVTKEQKNVKKSIPVPGKGILEKNGTDGVKERYKMKKGNAKKTTEKKRNVSEEPKNAKKVKKATTGSVKEVHEKNYGCDVIKRSKGRKESTKKATEEERNLTEKQKNVKGSISVPGREAKQ